MTRLFFYGTLMSGGSRGSTFGADAVVSIRPATIRGDLFSVGDMFPAYVEGDGVVHGEVWEIAPEAVEAVLRTTDMIESYREWDPASSMYLRVEVETLEGEQVQTYLWNGGEHMLSGRIESGDWRNRARMPMEAA